MRSSLRAAMLLPLLITISAPAQQHRVTDLDSNRLKGRVRSVIVIQDFVAPESVRRWYRVSDFCAKCEFDEQGWIRQRNSAVTGGKPIGKVEVNRDALGRPLQEMSFDASGAATGRTETTYGSWGPVEVKTFSPDQTTASAIETTEYSTTGQLLRTRRVDANGSVTFDISYKYDEEGRQVEQVVDTPQGLRREVRRWNDNVSEMITYMGNDDQLVMRATFDGEQLTSWWMEPKANYGIGFSVVGGTRGQSITYSSRDDGKLEKTVYVHPGATGNTEPDEVLHYDPDGMLVEDARISYQRDEHGNWIMREITVNDPERGLVVVQKDKREITYW